MFVAVPSSSGMPSDAIASVKISVAGVEERRSQHRDRHVAQHLERAAPALRAASSSDESARESAASQVM